MGPLASKAGPSGLFPPRPERVFCIGRALRLPIARGNGTVRLAVMVCLLNHVPAVLVGAVFGRVRSRGLITSNVLGHCVCICIRRPNEASIDVQGRIQQICRQGTQSSSDVGLRPNVPSSSPRGGPKTEGLGADGWARTATRCQDGPMPHCRNIWSGGG